MKDVTLMNVLKRFGKVVAVNNVSFHVEKGEFFSLLGPSGCGKTTTLRLIAGFEKPDKGEIYIGETLVNELPPEKRNVGIVFQNYALFPHMTVFDNIAFPLKIRGLSKEEIRRRVKELLELVRLEGLENRYPRQLSGGQQQRVALARALARDPEILLLDEPLSNLDAKLRVTLRYEIRRVQKEVGITAIYVTHDQEEALSISDRVAIMNMGRIEQIGTPEEVYSNPQTYFVADFLGLKNIFEGKLVANVLKFMNMEIKLGSKPQDKEGDVLVVIKPDSIGLSKELPKPLHDKVVVKGVVREKIFMGSLTKMLIHIGEKHEIETLYPSAQASEYSVGQEVYVVIDMNGIKII